MKTTYIYSKKTVNSTMAFRAKVLEKYFSGNTFLFLGKCRFISQEMLFFLEKYSVFLVLGICGLNLLFSRGIAMVKTELAVVKRKNKSQASQTVTFNTMLNTSQHGPRKESIQLQK